MSERFTALDDRTTRPPIDNITNPDDAGTADCAKDRVKIVQQPPKKTDAPTGIKEWLENIGLEKYATVFAENDIDTEVLPDLDDNDLKTMGVSLGHRKKILKEIASLQMAAMATSAAAGNTAHNQNSNTSVSPRNSPEAERRQLTVMFADLVGSTSLSTRVDIEVLHEVNRAYQDACSAEIQRFEGFVARYMGDGVLAYFGYPQAHEDDAERAVRAALSLIKSMDKLTVSLGHVHDFEFKVRIGIATGSVVVGNIIGEGASQESAVVGETPNLAARLQNLASPNNVVIASKTHKLAGETFVYEELAPQAVKGINRPVKTYRVLDTANDKNRFEATRTALPASFVGRQKEIELLRNSWQQASQGQGQAVLISGEPGIGKSRLSIELGNYLQNQSTQLQTFNFQCSPYHTNSDLFPVTHQLEKIAGFRRTDNNDRKLTRLEKLCSTTSDSIAQSSALFASVLSIPFENRYPPLELTPEQRKELTLKDMLRHLKTVSRSKPVLLIFEDIHWIDPTSRELIEMVVSEIHQYRMLAVFTYRPEFKNNWDALAHVSKIELTRLSDMQRHSLLTEMTHGKSLPKAISQLILDKTDGVPLFIEELTKTIIESDFLMEKETNYILARPLPPRAIPSTLQDSLMARLDRLGAVKETAQTCAVIGREFSFELISAVSLLSEAHLSVALTALVEAGLLTRTGTVPDATFSFKHALVQDTAYESLLKSRLQRLHLRIAETLATRFPAIVDTNPEVVANHFAEAKQWEDAVHLWHSAGNRATQRSAHVEACHHFSSALGSLENLPASQQNDRHRLDLLIDGMASESAVKGYSAFDLETNSSQAIALSQKLGGTPQIFPALYARFKVSHGEGRLTQALQQAKDIHELAVSQKDEIHLLIARRAMALCMVCRSEISGALKIYEQILASVDNSKADKLQFVYGLDSLVPVYSYRAVAYAHRGQISAAYASATSALERARHLGDPVNSGFALTVTGLMYYSLLDKEKFRSNIDQLAAILEQQSMQYLTAFLSMFQGCIALLNQDYITARDNLKQAIDEYTTVNHNVQMPFIYCQLAQAHLALGDSSDAMKAIELAHSEIALGRDNRYESELHRIQAGILQTQNKSSDAIISHLTNAIEVARKNSAKIFELRARTCLARYLHQQGNTDHAVAALKNCCTEFDSEINLPDITSARNLLATLLASRKTV